MKPNAVRKAKLPDTWPALIEVQGHTARIYKVERPTGYTDFKLTFYADGKRQMRSFADYGDAVKEANRVGATLSKGDAKSLTLASTDRLAYLRAVDALKPTGTALDLAAIQFADAHRRLAGRTIGEAVDFFLKRNPAKLPSKTVEEAVAEFIAFTQQNGASPVYLKDLDFRLGKFAETFHCQLASVTAAELNAFLRSLTCAKRGKANYKGAIRTLFKFAGKEKWLPKDHVDWSDVDNTDSETGEIQIFTPDEITKLLAASQLKPDELANGFNVRYATGQGLLPLLVLGGFAGLRTAEVQRQLWTDINTERGFIRVTAAKGNTAQKRLVPISENLKAWLALCRRDSGVCCDYPRPNEAIVRLVKRAGVEWKHNGLRHSFISYRVADTQDVAKVSLEAGNSPKMIHRHYRELVTPEEAKAWFAVHP